MLMEDRQKHSLINVSRYHQSVRVNMDTEKWARELDDAERGGERVSLTVMMAFPTVPPGLSRALDSFL